MKLPCSHHEGIQGGTEVQLHSFLTSALDEGEWSVSGPACVTTVKEPPVGRLQSQSGRLKEEKHLSPLPGFKDRIAQPVD